MARPKKKTSPKVVPIIPPIVAAVAGVAGRVAVRSAAKKMAKDVVKRKATGPKNTKDLAKLGKALNKKTKGVKGQPLVDLSNNASKRRGGNFAGGATTRAGAPSRLIDRNIARHSALRKKYPDKFKP